MKHIIDIHTHHAAPQPEALISVTPPDFDPMGNQLYSVGIHPWDTDVEITMAEWKTLEDAAVSPSVMAIGECGIDRLKGGPLFRQMQIFKRQIDLSERVGRPLVVHDVKAHDIITGLKRDLKTRQNWVVHGFRGNPNVVKMLTDAGIWLSFGEKFNADSLKAAPREMILAETDESSLTIMEVISRLSQESGEDLLPLIVRNTEIFLGLPSPELQQNDFHQNLT